MQEAAWPVMTKGRDRKKSRLFTSSSVLFKEMSHEKLEERIEEL